MVRLPIVTSEPQTEEEKQYNEAMKSSLQTNEVIALDIAETFSEDFLDKSISSYELTSMSEDTFSI